MNKRIYLCLGVSIAALAVAAVVLAQNEMLKRSRDKYRREWAHIQSEYDKLRVEQEEGLVRNAVQARCAKELEEACANQAMLMGYSEIEQLRRAGLPDPVRQLRENLMAHREIIPFGGVLGGTMGFYRDYDIALLDGRWVFARFEDGHIGGSCLLEYELSPDTTIKWTLIKARLW
jgi:hypothetical protein